jgi:DNA (cytosine-5)-methyltransferase 1
MTVARRSLAPVTLSVIDLFAGCGGLTAGFRAAGGYTPVAAVELDLQAAATYAENFGDHLHVGDIASWSESEMPAADVVVGGPPCQGFSALGKQDPDDPRSALWNEYLRVLQRVSPDFFVLENVPQFLRSQQFRDLQAETRRGGRLSKWRLEAHLLNAAHYGAAQARRRAIVIGRRSGTQELGLPRQVAKPATLRQVLKGVNPRVRDTQLPESSFIFRGQPVRGVYKMADLHVTRRPTLRSLERFANIPTGGNRFDLPEDLKTPGWRQHTTGSGDVMGRLHWDKPSVTIRTEFYKPEKGRYLHPVQHRPITHLEAALIQGFPQDFLWCGTKIAIARQIGNAVPVPLGRAIARLILDRAAG